MLLNYPVYLDDLQSPTNCDLAYLVSQRYHSIFSYPLTLSLCFISSCSLSCTDPTRGTTFQYFVNAIIYLQHSAPLPSLHKNSTSHLSYPPLGGCKLQLLPMHPIHCSDKGEDKKRGCEEDSTWPAQRLVYSLEHNIGMRTFLIYFLLSVF